MTALPITANSYICLFFFVSKLDKYYYYIIIIIIIIIVTLISLLQNFSAYCIKGVTKISSSWVNTTSSWGIIQLGISFGAIFLLFSYESSQGHIHSSRGTTPPPPHPPSLNDSSDTDLRGLMVVLENKVNNQTNLFFRSVFFQECIDFIHNCR